MVTEINGIRYMISYFYCDKILKINKYCHTNHVIISKIKIVKAQTILAMKSTIGTTVRRGQKNALLVKFYQHLKVIIFNSL